MSGLQYTRVTVFHVVWLVAVVAGGVAGAALGSRLLGTAGAIGGGIVGVLVGHAAGVTPDWLNYRLMFRHITRSSNEELWKMVNVGFWDFWQTMALLQLAARGQDVRTQLPRIVKLLESDRELERMYGWDALRLVFPPETEMAAGYDPRATTPDRSDRLAKLKAAL